jgi:hypothetical protein
VRGLSRRSARRRRTPPRRSPACWPARGPPPHTARRSAN